MSYEKVSAEVDRLLASFTSTAIEENAKTVGDRFEEAIGAVRSPKAGLALPQWKQFTRCLAGIRPHEFTILCGPTGSGKTMLLANIATMLALEGHTTFVAPVETGSIDFIHRMMGLVAGREINTFTGVSEEFVRDFKARHGSLFFGRRVILAGYETRVSHRQLMCDIYHSHMTHGATVFLLDNLNFMLEITNARDSVSEMDRVIHDLVVFCKLLPIHIVMVMHPKKTDGGRVESEFDIKGSSTAVQEASNVILWNRIEQTKIIEDENMRGFYREMKFCKIRKQGQFVGQRVFFKRDLNSENLREQS